MSLVLRNMPLYRFRYVDVNGRERFAVLRKGQSIDHLNISDETLGLLKRLIVGINGEPHPVFMESAPAAAPAAAAAAAPAAEPVAEVSAVEEIVEAPVAAAKPAAKKASAKPKAKAKKPTVNS